MKIGQSAGKSWEYITGVYLGDGCVTKAGRTPLAFRLNTIDLDFAEATRAALRNLTSRAVIINTQAVKKSAKPNHALWCGDFAICARLREETDSKAKLPEWIWTVDRDGALAFIAGLMDSEGFVSRNSHGSTYMGFKSTDPWFYDFIRVLNRAGIEVGKVGVERPLKAHYRTPRRFHIKLTSWVNSGAYFSIARKQGRVDAWIASQLTSETNMQNAA